MGDWNEADNEMKISVMMMTLKIVCRLSPCTCREVYMSDNFTQRDNGIGNEYAVNLQQVFA